MHNCFLYVYLYSLHVSGSHLPSSGELYQRDTWYMSLCVDDRLVCRSEFIPTCIPDGHLHKVTYTSCRIDTINYPDDGHMATEKCRE